MATHKKYNGRFKGNSQIALLGLFLALPCLSGCEVSGIPNLIVPEDTGSKTDGDALSIILITPVNGVLEVDLNTPGSQEFTALGIYKDNHKGW